MTAMRIYLPLTDPDRLALSSASTQLELPEGRSAWGVTASARTDRPDQDEEDLEYEAIQDAVHVALLAGAADARALVIAADAPDNAFEEAAESGGAFGLRTRVATHARIASMHVTELDAAAADADDTDPALLWFDPSETADALTYLEGKAQDRDGSAAH
ncbi:DUF6912 family protein [Brachybacterium alimentarium]|uniref:DUF6912 family protein n=1 Tax=Brachybacterium alimentarium TaxID=47845 RepID=UPI003FD455CF